jgi:hypothetical protein
VQVRGGKKLSNVAVGAAVRLNREEIKPSPAIYSMIADSIRLAEMIQARLQRRFSHSELEY